VRELENDVKARLRQRARQHGRSMEEEVRNILRQAVSAADRPVRRLGSQIAARFRGAGLTAGIPELGGEAARPATFDE